MKIRNLVFNIILCFAVVVSLSIIPVNVSYAKTRVKVDKEEIKVSPEEEVFSLVNEKREEEGLDPLAWNKTLTKDASSRAKEISKKFSHTRPNGKEWYTLDEKNMYGENLGKNYSTAQEVFDAWMNSESHKENILWKDFTQIGIALYITKDGSYYWVQEFGY